MTDRIRLTHRGVSALIMRATGQTNAEIAGLYGISEDFARTTIRRAVLALGARDVAHALAILFVADPTLLDDLRQHLTVPEQAHQALRDLDGPERAETAGA